MHILQVETWEVMRAATHQRPHSFSRLSSDWIGPSILKTVAWGWRAMGGYEPGVKEKLSLRSFSTGILNHVHVLPNANVQPCVRAEVHELRRLDADPPGPPSPPPPCSWLLSREPVLWKQVTLGAYKEFYYPINSSSALPKTS